MNQLMQQGSLLRRPFSVTQGQLGSRCETQTKASHWQLAHQNSLKTLSVCFGRCRPTSAYSPCRKGGYCAQHAYRSWEACKVHACNTALLQAVIRILLPFSGVPRRPCRPFGLQQHPHSRTVRLQRVRAADAGTLGDTGGSEEPAYEYKPFSRLRESNPYRWAPCQMLTASILVCMQEVPHTTAMCRVAAASE